MARGRTKGSTTHKWTIEDMEFIKNNAHLGIDYLCETLNLRKHQIIMKAFKNGVSIRKDLDEPIRKMCKACHSNPVGSKGRTRTKSKRRLWDVYCYQCKKYSYKKNKKDQCERCGFKPEWKGQLDVDHIDGNKHNNNLDNLMTLCANCHRLKTHMNRDYDSYKVAVNE